MKKVAIVSCCSWMNRIKEDILLKEELENRGFTVDIIAWDSDFDINNYDGYIIRSIWGYHNQYQEFKYFLSKMKNQHIYNSCDMILNNIDKEKQFNLLDKYNINHIPTQFCHTLDEVKNYIGKSLIIKPTVSGSGENTFMINDKNSFKVINKVYTQTILKNGIGIMLQPYIKQIENGEYACIFIDGKNTHNMLRFPGVFAEKKKPIYLKNIPNSVLNLAEKVAKIPEYQGYLYMRVDIIVHDNNPTVMEVELADPDLLIKYITDEVLQKDVILKFATAIEKRV